MIFLYCKSINFIFELELKTVLYLIRQFIQFQLNLKKGKRDVLSNNIYEE